MKKEKTLLPKIIGIGVAVVFATLFTGCAMFKSPEASSAGREAYDPPNAYESASLPPPTLSSSGTRPSPLSGNNPPPDTRIARIEPIKPERATPEPSTPVRPAAEPRPAPRPTPSETPAPAAAPGTEAAGLGTEVIRVGDIVYVTFTGVGEAKPRDVTGYRITNDGNIILDLVGNVKAVGRTVADLQKDIYDKYVPNYFRLLTVAVQIQAENRFFYVHGQVNREGKVEFHGEITLTRAIASAGGFNEFAKKSRIEIHRENGKKLLVDWRDAEKNPKFDIPIYPGDRIFVPRRFW